MDSHNIMFIILAVVMICSSVACVVSKSVIRAATYLFFTLLGTAGIYFLMGYTFLGSVQVMVYCGGVVVLYVFAIMLTRGHAGVLSKATKSKMVSAGILSLAGMAIFIFALLKNQFINAVLEAPDEEVLPIKEVGHQMLSTGTNGYLLPFEIVSVLLLACIVAALVIARKR